MSLLLLKIAATGFALFMFSLIAFGIGRGMHKTQAEWWASRWSDVWTIGFVIGGSVAATGFLAAFVAWVWGA